VDKTVALAEGDVVSRCRAIIKPGEYMILPQANRVTSVLPNLRDTDVQVLATPEFGARFIECELLVRPGGGTIKPIDDGLEHFLFILQGGIRLIVNGSERELVEGSYAWLPPDGSFALRNHTAPSSRVLWLRRRCEKVDGLTVPGAIIANERDVPATPEDTYLEQRLIPYENPAFDMGVNLLNFEPGVYFGFVESHVMEHGLYMLAGRGIYWLNGDYHEVQANDFIYMAPYCPQFFYATGWETGRYLVYKDVNRDYAATL
jgi:(S)-ureidoglycine aminohydrolase